MLSHCPDVDATREKTPVPDMLQNQSVQNAQVEVAAVFKYIIVTSLNPSIFITGTESVNSSYNSQQINATASNPLQSFLLPNDPGVLEQFPPSQYEVIEITSNVDLSNATATIGPEGDISFTFPLDNNWNIPAEPHTIHDNTYFDSHLLIPENTHQTANASNLSHKPDFDSLTLFSIGTSPTSETEWQNSTYSDYNLMNTKDSKDLLLDSSNPLGDMWPRRRSELAKTRSVTSTSSVGSEYLDVSQTPRRKNSNKRVTFAEITEEFDSEEWEERAKEYRNQKKVGRKSVFKNLQLSTSPISIDSFSSEERISSSPSRWGLKKTAKSFKSFFKTSSQNYGNTPPGSPLGFRINDFDFEDDVDSEITQRGSPYFVHHSISDLNQDSKEFAVETPDFYDFENNVDQVNTKDTKIDINIVEDQLRNTSLNEVNSLKAEIGETFKILDIYSSSNHSGFENWSIELGSTKAS
ncbi:hypothetical protein HK096_006182 [Nowakowskiella sp. JEL0078]|nr:hypothetical protein HK096_006182 [Nowakowskiella sp. JEL0078]